MLSENEIQQHNSGGALILIGLKRSWCVHKVKAIEWDKYGMLNKQLLQTILYVHLLWVNIYGIWKSLGTSIKCELYMHDVYHIKLIIQIFNGIQKVQKY